MIWFHKKSQGQYLQTFELPGAWHNLYMFPFSVSVSPELVSIVRHDLIEAVENCFFIKNVSGRLFLKVSEDSNTARGIGMISLIDLALGIHTFTAAKT